MAVLARDQQLDAVAGGEDHAFAHAGMTGEARSGVGELRFRNGQSFAHLDGSAAMVDSEEAKSHDCTNLCTTLK